VDELLIVYKDFHSNPEMSFREERTAAKLAAELKSLGTEVTTGVGQMGVIGLRKNGDGPVIMIRTDLDALPVVEATGLAFASKVIAKDPKGNDVGAKEAITTGVTAEALFRLLRPGTLGSFDVDNAGRGARQVNEDWLR